MGLDETEEGAFEIPVDGTTCIFSLIGVSNTIWVACEGMIKGVSEEYHVRWRSRTNCECRSSSLGDAQKSDGYEAKVQQNEIRGKLT